MNQHRDVGRPRVFSDDAIFRATNDLIERNSYDALTLEAIATEVGCTRQALVRRFGSKQALLLAFLDRTLVLRAADYRIVEADAPSPLAALRARFVAPPEERMEISADREIQANLLAFMLTSSGDPAFAARFEALNQIYMDEMERLVRAAVEMGELAGIDPAALARALFSASLGETVRWASTPSIVPHVSRLGEIFDLLVMPHRLRS